MKKNNGITLIILVVVIVILIILLGLTVTTGYSLLEKSRAGKMITYMELIEARANTVYEDLLFESINKEDFESKDINVMEIKVKADSTDEEKVKIEENIVELEKRISVINNSYTYFKWDKEMLAKNGIDKNILGSNEEYFVIAFDYNTQKVVGIYCYNGCAIDGERYYSLEDLRENISK